LSVCPHPCKAWRKKIPERSEDDFFPANQPGRAALRELRGKLLFLQQEMRMLDIFKYSPEKITFVDRIFMFYTLKQQKNDVLENFIYSRTIPSVLERFIPKIKS
jgi:hypothetical protein